MRRGFSLPRYPDSALSIGSDTIPSRDSFRRQDVEVNEASLHSKLLGEVGLSLSEFTLSSPSIVSSLSSLLVTGTPFNASAMSTSGFSLRRSAIKLAQRRSVSSRFLFIFNKGSQLNIRIGTYFRVSGVRDGGGPKMQAFFAREQYRHGAVPEHFVVRKYTVIDGMPNRIQ